MDSGNRSVFSTYKAWATSSIATSLLLVYLAPTYSVGGSFTLTAASIFCLQWLVYGIYAVIIYPRFLSPLRHLPEPPGNSFFNGQWSVLIKEPSGLPMRRWINEIPNNGLIRYKHLFNRDRVLVTSPKGLAEVLTTKSYDFVKPDFMRIGIGQILGVGVLLAEGDEHKMQRKGLMPAFNFRHIKELYPIFWSKSVEMVQGIQASLPATTPASLEVGEWASRATLDIIGVAGMGQDFNSIANPDTELNRVYRTIFQPSKSAQFLGLLQFFIPHWIIRSLPVKRNDDVRAAAGVARETSRRLIQEKKLAMASNKSLPPDIISVALSSGYFTDEKLVDNMMTFLAAGHETTASAFTWAIYLMCQSPPVQTKLREEVRSHISSLTTDEKITSEIIDNMPYLHAVCNEVLRIYSPVPLTLRDTAKATTILGQYIPKGTKVVLAPWAVNYSTELWGPDAAEFKPERWMAPGQANAGGAESNYAFLTFLHGPRSCIGSKFAVAELACLLAAFVGVYEFEKTDPNEKIEIKGGVTARPRDGMNINVKLVEGW
jgi:cytochrome P450